MSYYRYQEHATPTSTTLLPRPPQTLGDMSDHFWMSLLQFPMYLYECIYFRHSWLIFTRSRCERPLAFFVPFVAHWERPNSSDSSSTVALLSRYLRRKSDSLTYSSNGSFRSRNTLPTSAIGYSYFYSHMGNPNFRFPLLVFPSFCLSWDAGKQTT